MKRIKKITGIMLLFISLVATAQSDGDCNSAEITDKDYFFVGWELWSCIEFTYCDGSTSVQCGSFF